MYMFFVFTYFLKMKIKDRKIDQPEIKFLYGMKFDSYYLHLFLDILIVVLTS